MHVYNNVYNLSVSIIYLSFSVYLSYTFCH